MPKARRMRWRVDQFTPHPSPNGDTFPSRGRLTYNSSYSINSYKLCHRTRCPHKLTPSLSFTALRNLFYVILWRYSLDLLEYLGKIQRVAKSRKNSHVLNADYPLLHQNGTIYWLKRDLNKLPTDGRPLSQMGKLADMYEKRRPLYEAFADTVIDNDRTLEESLAQFTEVCV